MDLRIKVSFQMSKDKSPLGNIEDRLIRIPKEARERLGLKIGRFLRLKSKAGSVLPLQITHAYKSDTDVDPSSAYVSDLTYDEISFETISTLDPAEDILIGCDPEFFIVDGMSGRNLSASHFFSHYGEVGSDAGLAELRPRPSMDVNELTKSMEVLMFQAYKHLEGRMLYRKRPIYMVAASMHDNATAGFHVHFGLPDLFLDGSQRAYNLLVKMVYVLDYYVGIPSVLPEGEEDYWRRSRRYSQYGKPGDFRADDKITLEYRVPGGHLLRHPILTMGLLAMSATVMKDMLSRLKVHTDNFRNLDILKRYEELRDFYPNIPDRSVVYHTVTNEKIGKALSYSDRILRDLQKMIGFSYHKKYILDYFSYVIGYLGRGQKYTESIEHNWRLAHYEGQ
jgi:hypothetical protein